MFMRGYSLSRRDYSGCRFRVALVRSDNGWMPALAAEPNRSAPTITLPEAGWLLVFASVLLISGCLAAAGLGIAFIVSWPGPGTLLGGLLLVIGPVWLALLQYRTTFRWDLPAAVTMKNWWLIFAGFTAVQLPLPTLAQLPHYRQFQAAYYFVVVPLLIVFVSGVILHRQWARALQKAESLPQQPLWKFKLGELLLLMGAVALTFGVTNSCLRAWSGRYAEHVALADCPCELPAAARDISYCYSPWQELAYEFSIDEAGAVEWAESLDLHLMQPITGSTEIQRYGSLAPTLHRNKSATITNGWQSAGYVDGKQVRIAYDKDYRRAYYLGK